MLRLGHLHWANWDGEVDPQYRLKSLYKRAHWAPAFVCLFLPVDAKWPAGSYFWKVTNTQTGVLGSPLEICGRRNSPPSNVSSIAPSPPKLTRKKMRKVVAQRKGRISLSRCNYSGQWVTAKGKKKNLILLIVSIVCCLSKIEWVGAYYVVCIWSLAWRKEGEGLAVYV